MPTPLFLRASGKIITLRQKRRTVGGSLPVTALRDCSFAVPSLFALSCGLIRSVDAPPGKSLDAGIGKRAANTEEAPEEHLRGFPKSMRPGPPTGWPKPQNTTTQEDTYKVAKSPLVPNHGLDVHFWHLADIDADAEHVRFWKASGHALTKAFLCRGGPYDLTSVKALKLSRPHLSLPTFP
jgi:hypothetical protein